MPPPAPEPPKFVMAAVPWRDFDYGTAPEKQAKWAAGWDAEDKAKWVKEHLSEYPSEIHEEWLSAHKLTRQGLPRPALAGGAQRDRPAAPYPASTRPAAC